MVFNNVAGHNNWPNFTNIGRQNSQNPINGIGENNNNPFNVKWREFEGEFVHLHTHGPGSIGDALNTNYEKVGKMFRYYAVTDHHSFHSIIDLALAAKKYNFKPIFGIEFYTDNYLNSIKGSNIQHKKHGRYHLLVLTKSLKGLLGLYQIITKNELKKTSPNQKLPINISELIPFKDELVCLSACLGGELPQYIMHNQLNEAKEFASRMKDIFGEDFYLEIQKHNIPGEDYVNESLARIGRELNIELAATADVHYMEKEDKPAHNAIMCLTRKKGNGQKIFTLKDEGHPSLPGEDYHLLSTKEMEDKFRNYPRALDNTVRIAQKCCNVEIPFPNNLEEYHFPNFPKTKLPPGMTARDYFIHQCQEGFRIKFANTDKFNDPIYRERLNMELNVILQLKFEDYFLIIQDLCLYCKSNNILVGPGRGSVGGSLVSFVLGITNTTDPIRMNASFERFLNIARLTAPDIDLDFPPESRPQIFEYLKHTYGEDHTAQIVTFGTRKARAAVKDAGRALGYKPVFSQKVANLIPKNQEITISEAMMSSELRQAYDSDERIKEIIDLAIRIEGTVSHKSTHAAGFIIADKPLYNYTPITVATDKNGELYSVTSFTMTQLEQLGLLKLDVLGLATLPQVSNCLDFVNQKLAQRNIPAKTFDDIPITDVEVYKNLIGKGDTFGIFQLGGNGAKNLSRRFFSTPRQDGWLCFLDLAAGLALNRPGPKASIPKYLENKDNPQLIQYKHPLLEGILSWTNGCLVYQEQISMIAQALAGYPATTADIFRKSIGKKDVQALMAQKKPFIYGQDDEHGNIIIKGCIRNGVPEHIAHEIFDDLAEFARYGFNIPHAGSYAVIAAKGAFLKYYFPTEFMASLLISAMTDNDKNKLPLTLKECESMGIRVLQPDINKSSMLFSPEENKTIRYGLGAIKNVGISTIETLIQDRMNNGEFKSMQDLANRMQELSVLKKDTLEALIYAGALDCFGGTRKSKIEDLQTTLNNARRKKAKRIDLVSDLISSNKEESYLSQNEFSKSFKLRKEWEFAKAFISEHPLDNFKELLNSKSFEVDFAHEIHGDNNDDYSNIKYKDGDIVKILGVVIKKEVKQSSRSNNSFITFELADKTGVIGGTANIQFDNDLEVGSVVYAKAKLSYSDEYGAQLVFATIYKAFTKSDQLTTDILQYQGNSSAIIFSKDQNIIEKLDPLVNLFDFSSNSELYISNLFTCENYKLKVKISLNKQEVLNILKDTSDYIFTVCNNRRTN